MFNTLQIYLGSLYVNDFNLFGHTFRVTLQADKDARAAPSDLNKLYVRNATGGMVPLSALGALQADRRAGDRAALQQLRLGADQRRAGARLQLEPGGRGDAARRGGRRCRAISATNGPASPIRSSAPARSRRSCSALAIVLRLHDPRRAIRELDDAVHGAVVGAAGAGRRARRALGAPDADRRLFADRLRHADRPRGEERDPDRRIRQAAARGRARASSRRRWRRDGCGCGRS